MIWIVILMVLAFFIAALRGISKDKKPFKVIPFKVKFNALIQHLKDGYFTGECTLYEPTDAEVRLIGNGSQSNKMVTLYYTGNILFVDIRMKLYQVEYKKEYSLQDPLLKTEESLVKFADNLAIDFGQFLISKT